MDGAPALLTVATREVRWFVRGAAPESVRAWFDALGGPVPEATRTDRYLVPRESAEVGVKLREGRLEVKQRTAHLGIETWGGVSGEVEGWVKWSFDAATRAQPHAGWADVTKTRRLRRLTLDGRAPRSGRPHCALELGAVTLEDGRDDGAAWWTVCLEAQAATANERGALLEHAASAWLTGDAAPPDGLLTEAASMGYAEWLRRHADSAVPHE